MWYLHTCARCSTWQCPSSTSCPAWRPSTASSPTTSAPATRHLALACVRFTTCASCVQSLCCRFVCPSVRLPVRLYMNCNNVNTCIWLTNHAPGGQAAMGGPWKATKEWISNLTVNPLGNPDYIAHCLARVLGLSANTLPCQVIPLQSVHPATCLHAFWSRVKPMYFSQILRPIWWDPRHETPFYVQALISSTLAFVVLSRTPH